MHVWLRKELGGSQNETPSAFLGDKMNKSVTSQNYISSWCQYRHHTSAITLLPPPSSHPSQVSPLYCASFSSLSSNFPYQWICCKRPAFSRGEDKTDIKTVKSHSSTGKIFSREFSMRWNTMFCLNQF